jgi:uncharacterized protein YjbI with pentapeptide repeats
MIGESLNLEIWNRLIQDKSLDGLSLPSKDGRLDLNGLDLPDPLVIRRFEFKGRPVSEIEPGVVIRGAKWQNLDFSGSRLRGMRLFGCDIENCRFDDCRLEGLRMWSMSIRDTSFKGADLRNSALGGVQDGTRNVFVGIDFTDADMRGTVYKAAAFDRCLFRNSRLVKIDFQTSTFTNCRFEGELNDVLFYRRGFRGETFPANEMLNVDFTGATLHDVGFRGLVLDRVQFPSDDEHVVIKDFASALDRMTETFTHLGDATAKKLIAFVRMHRKWAVPNQVQGVVNITDLREVVGEEGVARFLAAIPH